MCVLDNFSFYTMYIMKNKIWFDLILPGVFIHFTDSILSFYQQLYKRGRNKGNQPAQQYNIWHRERSANCDNERIWC